MSQITRTISNKAKQYANRLFYISPDDSTVLYFNDLFYAISKLHTIIETKVRNDEPRIAMVSSNTLFKIIVVTYCFLTNTKLLLISPKFSVTEIINSLLAKKTNILLVDKYVLSMIEEQEIEEDINILNFFLYIGTPGKLMETMLSKSNTPLHLTNVISAGMRREQESSEIAHMSVLSVGTTSPSCITNIPYSLLGKSMMDLTYFMGLQPATKVSVFADVEFYPGINTILGLLTGIQFTQSQNNSDVQSVEELTSILQKNNTEVVFISSDNFKTIWDNVLLKVYTPFIFLLSKYNITKWIVNIVLRKEISRIFGKSVKKVHILNEELGFTILDILKKSKIMFSSSYGFLEQGNFLAFKDPSLFKHKEFIYKPGGTVLKDTEVFLSNIQSYDSTKMTIGEICLTSATNAVIHSTDQGTFIKNITEQGDRKFLYVYRRKPRHSPNDTISKDLLERTIKDNWIIRDCLIISRDTFPETWSVMIEVREDLLDLMKLKWEDVENHVHSFVRQLDETATTKITHFGIIKFNGMRNVAGKLQYYNT